MNSICVRRKATLCRFFSCAFFDPLQMRAPFISTPIKFLFGYFSARPIEYSPFPQPSSSTIGFSFLKYSLFHFPLSLKSVFLSVKRNSCTFSKVRSSAKRCNLFFGMVRIYHLPSLRGIPFRDKETIYQKFLWDCFPLRFTR